MQKHLLGATVFMLLMSCKPTVFTPKPIGYYKLDTPAAHVYQTFDLPDYPYAFEYPTYSHTAIDSAFFKEKADNPYWLNLEFPTLGATINLTYKKITPNETLLKMVSESYELSFFHHEKADYIQDQYMRNSNGITIVLYNVGGNSASKYQFTATDSVHHFMRGALYFPVTPNADSLRPATDFLEQDIRHLLLTLRFR